MNILFQYNLLKIDLLALLIIDFDIYTIGNMPAEEFWRNDYLEYE